MDRSENLQNYFLGLLKRPPAFYPWLRNIMSTLAGVLVLSQILDWAWKGKAVKLTLRKFCKSDKQIIMETSVTKRELELVKKKLKELPFLKIKVKGKLHQTWYYFDLNKWSEFLKSTPWPHTESQFPVWGICEPEDGDEARNHHKTPFGGSVSSVLPRGHARNAHTPSGVDPGRRDTTLEKHPRWVSYSNQLASSIQKVRNLNKKSNIRNWAYSFFRIHKDGVPIPRIKSVLDWYCKELEAGGDLIRNNPKYLCIAYTGQKFREKFDKLEGQMQRHQDQDLHENGPKVKIKKTILVTMTKAEREAKRKEMGM